MKKLSDVIAELEKTANEKEYQSKHGTLLSSISEDIAEGKIADEFRKVIETLKQVTVL
jgi:hypothetical protein